MMFRSVLSLAKRTTYSKTLNCFQTSVCKFSTSHKFQAGPKLPKSSQNKDGSVVDRAFDWRTVLIAASIGSIGILMMKHYKKKLLKEIDTGMIKWAMVFKNINSIFPVVQVT